MLWAVHILDGVLAPVVAAGGFVPAAALVWYGLRGTADREIPRVGVMTAGFFVASQIHLPLAGASVHLLLNGVAGVVLGRRAAVAIPVGLLLQAVLFAHGGITSLGVNVTIYTVPAVLCGWAFPPLFRAGWVRRPTARTVAVFAAAACWLAVTVAAGQVAGWKFQGRSGLPESTWLAEWWVVAGVLVTAGLLTVAERRLEAHPDFAVGLLLGGLTAAATVAGNVVALVFGGRADYEALPAVILVAHLPVIAVEAVAVGFVVRYLAVAKPDWLTHAGSTSSSDTSH